MSPAVAIAVHGGAGTILREQLTEALERDYRRGLEAALRAGHSVLDKGGASTDAVVAAVSVLEDSPLFNAGRGSVLSQERRIEMEAAIMEGRELRAGAAVLLRHVQNPIQLAQRVMLNTPHVMLSGKRAEDFARSQGLQLQPESFFVTQRRLKQLSALQVAEPQGTALSETAAPDSVDVPNSVDVPDTGLGTVGAVALDQRGDLAAATSTGGMTNKWAGRIGDTPVIGAGTYADNRAAAVSTTGHGEMFLRIAAAHQVCERVRFAGVSLQQAADAVIFGELRAVGGSGGLIAIDTRGSIVFSLNAAGMYRGSIDVNGQLRTAIFADEATPAAASVTAS